MGLMTLKLGGNYKYVLKIEKISTNLGHAGRISRNLKN